MTSESQGMSVEGRWTKGPWEACEPGDYGDFDGESRVICGDDQRIAVVHWHPRLNTAESDANAHLIAAAPDMAADGRTLIDRLDEFFNEMEDGEEFGRFNGNVVPALARFRAALAKALGETTHD